MLFTMSDYREPDYNLVPICMYSNEYPILIEFLRNLPSRISVFQDEEKLTVTDLDNEKKIFQSIPKSSFSNILYMYIEVYSHPDGDFYYEMRGLRKFYRNEQISIRSLKDQCKRLIDLIVYIYTK